MHTHMHIVQGKRKKTEPVASSTTNHSSSSSSSSPLEDSTTGPAKKKPKITSQDDLLPPSLPPNSTPVSITSTTVTTAPSSTVVTSSSGPAKLPATRPKKHATLPIGASKYSRQTNTTANPSSQIGTKLGLGSTATAVVKKTTEELGASFKSPGSDPTARDAYKSLFQSACEPRPKEKTSNWVTFFPYH